MAAGGNKAQAGLACALSLESLDSIWQQTLSGSFAMRLFALVKAFMAKLCGPAAGKIGTCLQLGSFFFVLALVVLLGAPQFAAEKEGLAALVVVGVGLRLAGHLLSGQESYKPTITDALVLLFLAVNVISACSSHYLVESIKGLAKVAVYIAAYFLFAAVFSQSRQRVLAVFLLVIASGLAVAVYGLYQYKIGVLPLATWEDPAIEVKTTRIYSTLGNPNLLAGYLLPLLPVSLGAAFSSFAAKKWALALSLLAGCSVLFVAELLTGSRGGYLGTFVAIASFFVIFSSWLWQARPGVRPVLALCWLIVPVLLAGLLHFAPGFEQRLFSIFAGREHSSNVFRLNVWHSSWLMFLDSWWFGIGPGNQTFRLAYGLYMKSGFDALATYSVPLEILVETGLPGLVVFAALLVVVLARAHRNFWGNDSAWYRWVTAGLAAAVIGMMAHGLVDTVFYRPQVQLIFWLVVASLVAAPGRAATYSSAGSGKL